MTREEFNKLYLGKAVHCDTEEKANEFLALADSFGYKWMSGKSLIKKNNWEEYEEKTCYKVIEDGFMFGDTNYFNIGFSESIKYQPQLKFKVGDKIRVNNTLYTTINGKVGVIERVNSLVARSYAVKIDEDSWLWFLTEDELEKVEEQPKFKVGDKVRVKSLILTTIDEEVGVIVEVDPLSPLSYSVKVGSDEWTLWFYENQLEKVEEQTCEEETIDDIIEEIEYHQKAINVLHNRLKMKAKVGK